jgi:hypothetical protein
MPRIAFTIVFNGSHHLLHNDFINKMPKLFDAWCVVESLALPGGSTAWCKDLSEHGYASTDGTRELLIEASKEHGNVLVVLADKPWASKDEMVNKALSVIRSEVGVPKKCFLYECDVDECWNLEDLETAEKELIEKGGDCGCFHAEFYVGPGLVCRGTWGEGDAPDDPIRNAYRRLWRWDGRGYEKHEPPTLEGGNGKEVLLNPRFEHFSYYFEKDISFKEKYYRGYEGLLQRWTNLQKELIFPQSISYLLTDDWAKTATQIVRIDR